MRAEGTPRLVREDELPSAGAMTPWERTSDQRRVRVTLQTALCDRPWQRRRWIMILLSIDSLPTGKRWCLGLKIYVHVPHLWRLFLQKKLQDRCPQATPFASQLKIFYRNIKNWGTKRNFFGNYISRGVKIFYEILQKKFVKFKKILQYLKWGGKYVIAKNTFKSKKKIKTERKRYARKTKQH